MNGEAAPAGDLREVQAEWLARARSGDLTAFDHLVRISQKRIYNLLYNMTSHREDAEDLLQEVFLKAWQALPSFEGKSSFHTWVYRIAVNRAINFVKKRKRRQGMSLDDLDAGIERDPALVRMGVRENPEHSAFLGELQERLNTAVQKLSEKHRTVVILHDIEGLPHEEIGEILGCSAGTVRSRLFYARQHLQAELAEYTR